MGSTGRIAWVLTAVALAVIGLAAVPPSEGWIVRRQLEWQFRNPPSIVWISNEIGMGSPAESPAHSPTLTIAGIAQEHPRDVALQIAAASTPSPRVEALERLADRSPADPALTAAILRAFMLRGRMNLESEEITLTQTSSSSANGFPFSERPPPSVADVADFLKRADQGQHEDPQNGYFVAMRAIGLLAHHQTAPALSMLSDVGRCSVWKDYDGVPAQGQWTAVQAGFNDHRATLHGFIVASALMPEYSDLRALGRIALAQAIRLEQHGDTRAGIAIRHSIMECGALMRSSADSTIAALTGVALVPMGAEQPGGAPDPSTGDQAPAAQRMRLRLAAYQRFLLGHAQRQEAAWAASEPQSIARLVGVSWPSR